MGLFDEFGKALKKVEEEIKKSDLDARLRNVESGLNKAGSDITGGPEKTRQAKPSASLSAAQPTAQPAPPAPSRAPHPGYVKIAAWMKTKYRDRIAGTSEYQRGLELEQLSAEATAGLSAKAKKGFLEYLKKQHYEPLLK